MEFSFWEEDWKLRYNFIKRFLDFPDIPNFLRSEVLKVLRQLVRQLVYIPFSLLITTLRFTCGKRKNWYNSKKSQNIMTMFAG